MVQHQLAPHDEMALAGNCMREAYTHVLNYYHDEVQRNKYLYFTGALLLLHKPYMLLTQKGMEALAEQIFSDEEYRDFTLSLTYNFFLRLGDNSTVLANLCRALAGTMDTLPDAGSLIPTEVAARLVHKALPNTLQKNKWLVTILILQASVSIPYSAIKPGKEANKVETNG